MVMDPKVGQHRPNTQTQHVNQDHLMRLVQEENTLTRLKDPLRQPPNRITTGKKSPKRLIHLLTHRLGPHLHLLSYKKQYKKSLKKIQTPNEMIGIQWVLLLDLFIEVLEVLDTNLQVLSENLGFEVAVHLCPHLRLLHHSERNVVILQLCNLKKH